MNKILLDPVIIFLVLVLSIISCALLIWVVDKKKISSSIEIVLIAIFLIIISGATPIPFCYLNPASLSVANIKLTSVTFIFQFIFYPLAFFLLRSRIIRFYLGIGYLIRNPFLACFLLVTLFSFFWSETPFVTFRASAVIFLYAIFASYIAFHYSFQEIGKILRRTGTFITIAGALAAIFIPSVGRMQAPDVELAGTWQGILDHKNNFAFWIALTAAQWLLYAVNYPKSRSMSIGLAVISLCVMIQAQSGASKLIFLSMMSTVLLSRVVQQLKRWDFRKAVVVTLGLFIFSSLVAVVFSMNTAVFLKLLGKEATLTGRTEFWPQVIEAIWRKPLLGYGYIGFWQSWRGYENPSRTIITPVEFVPPNAHNGYLDILLATGLVGAVLFFLALLTILLQLLLFSKKSENGDAETAAMMLIFSLMTSFSESNIWGMNTYTFLFLLTSVRLSMEVTTKLHKNVTFPRLSSTES